MPKMRIPHPVLLIKLALIAPGVALLSHADSGEVSAATVTVNVGDFWFCNSSFSSQVCPTRIATGDTVTWNWVGTAQHSTTACSDGTFTTCGPAQGWDSGNKSSGTFSRTFNSTGTFFYHCEVYSNMRGRVELIQDTDNDGWSDPAEAVIGTNPMQKCGTNAWPADINDDGFSDISDLVPMLNYFGAAVPTAPARYNIAPDPADGVVDITDISTLTNLFGQRCTP